MSRRYPPGDPATSWEAQCSQAPLGSPGQVPGSAPAGPAVRVISLERSIERRTRFADLNRGLAYQFFPGIEIPPAPDPAVIDFALFPEPMPYFPSSGAFGCALSHLALWNLAIETEAPVTIAEDDAAFRHDFEQESRHVLDALPPAWDMVLWGWNFDSILSIAALPGVSPSTMLFSQEALQRSVQTFQLLRGGVSTFRLDKAFGIPAYTISPRGARRFKASCFPMRNFELFFPVLNRRIPNTGIDIAMNRIYPESASYVAFPPLVVTPNERQSSTIQKRH